MVTCLGTFCKIAIAVSPAVFVLVLTMVISFVTRHPEGLFLTRSIRGIPVRFVVLTILLADISNSPSVLERVLDRSSG